MTPPLRQLDVLFPFWRLFLSCWLMYAVHWAPFTIREHFPAITLATAGTLNVDRFLDWSPDIFPGPNGGAFINNNPGASLLGAVPLLIARPLLSKVERMNEVSAESRARMDRPGLEGGVAIRHHREWFMMLVAFLTAAGVMAPLSALTVCALASAIVRTGLTHRDALMAALFYGFATPVFVRTDYLNHNLMVAHATVFAAMALRPSDGSAPRPARVVGAGAACGFAVLCDFSGLVVLAGLGLYSVFRTKPKAGPPRPFFTTALAFIIGAAPGLLGLAVYQEWAFGHSALPSQAFMTPIAETSRGYRGIDVPSLHITWMNFFDRRFGLFVVCPILALAFLAPFARRCSWSHRRDIAAALTMFAGITFFSAANQYSSLQWSTGIRYLLPGVPGLAVLSVFVLRGFPRAAQWALVAMSVSWAWLQAITHRLPPELFDPREWQLSWARRLGEYGALERPGLVTALTLGGAVLFVAVIWRRPLSRVSGERRVAAT